MTEETKTTFRELEKDIQDSISEVMRLENCELEHAEELLNFFLEEVNVISHNTDRPERYRKVDFRKFNHV